MKNNNKYGLKDLKGILIGWILFSPFNLIADGTILAQKTVDDTKHTIKVDKAKQDLLKHFKTKEKITKDAIWNGDKFFYVGVWDDGSNRNGYAEYVCLVAYDYGLKGEHIYVKVVDYAKVVKQEGFEKLGEAFCN